MLLWTIAAFAAEPACDLAAYLAMDLTLAPGPRTQEAEDAEIVALHRAKVAAAEALDAACATAGDGARVEDRARVWLDLARALRGSTVPSYLTPTQREIHAMQLEDRARSHEERAVAIYEEAHRERLRAGLWCDRRWPERIAAVRGAADVFPPVVVLGAPEPPTREGCAAELARRRDAGAAAEIGWIAVFVGAYDLALEEVASVSTPEAARVRAAALAGMGRRGDADLIYAAALRADPGDRVALDNLVARARQCRAYAAEASMLRAYERATGDRALRPELGKARRLARRTVPDPYCGDWSRELDQERWDTLAAASARLDRARALLDSCRVDPALREAVTMVLDFTQEVVDERDTSMLPDMLTMLDAYEAEVHGACDR